MTTATYTPPAEDVHEQVSDQAAWALAQVTQDLVALLGVTSMEVT